MKRIVLGIALAFGLCFPQTITSKLNGKRIYLHRKDGGDHSEGYVGLQKLLNDKKAAYGYIFESGTGSPGQSELDALFNRLYKGAGPKDANAIDILIFCQGQGDQNVGGGSSVNPFGSAADRFTKVNNHVKFGGGLIMVHAAAGREVSWQNWFFGAKLMTDWFGDGYFASVQNSGNGGHFPYGTNGTYTLDEESTAAKDSSTFFIRNILTQTKAKNGYGQPLISPNVKGEWYHFNGGKKYEDGTGGAATHSNDKIAPMQVRGNPGVPDSGIGPAKIVGGLSKIESYVPPGGKIRPGVWAREVSNGVFNPKASATNGRFLYFNPGHGGEEYTDAAGWMGDFFLANLRWVAKEDRGCTNSLSSNYNALATVNDGSCIVTSVGRDARLGDGAADIGRIAVDRSAIEVSIGAEGPHFIEVAKINGERVFQSPGTGARKYQVPGLQCGFYLVQVNAGGKIFKKSVRIL